MPSTDLLQWAKWHYGVRVHWTKQISQQQHL